MPNSLQIGSLTIHYYGVIIMLGVVAATFLAQKEGIRRDQDEDGSLVWDLLVWVLIAGIIGARLWHVLTPMPDLIAQGITPYYYLTHPLDAIAVWNGGLGILGGVVGGMLALFWFTRRRHLSFPTWLDLLSPALALGQAIGRWGNFFNQELYGAPTHLPWAIYIDPQHRYPGYEKIAYYHPLFLYESLWNLMNMALLLWLSRLFKNWLRSGDIFLVYAIIYPFGRFVLEFLRLDASMVAGININQISMAGIALVSALVLLARHTLYPKSQTSQATSGE